MALRSRMNSLRRLTTIISRLQGGATAEASTVRAYSTVTDAKLKAHTTPGAVEFGQHSTQQQAGGASTGKKKRFGGDFMPVYVALGMITLAVTIGVYTVKHQIMHAPNVRMKKKERGTMPEVVDPERVAGEGDKFVKDSFFRKVANVQEFDPATKSDH
ncbi:hypothetical protein LINPERPRIM_LOCUS30597 [Linum perenne]